MTDNPLAPVKMISDQLAGIQKRLDSITDITDSRLLDIQDELSVLADQLDKFLWTPAKKEYENTESGT